MTDKVDVMKKIFAFVLSMGILTTPFEIHANASPVILLKINGARGPYARLISLNEIEKNDNGMKCGLFVGNNRYEFEIRKGQRKLFVGISRKENTNLEVETYRDEFLDAIPNLNIPEFVVLSSYLDGGLLLRVYIFSRMELAKSYLAPDVQYKYIECEVARSASP